mmetsp:Transcript_22430/g.47386  ORF Transcript_22430/g.47386 Transcript_22430/m.47386 type:complete len:232 (-) Transcript_22430:1423-2118(-)
MERMGGPRDGKRWKQQGQRDFRSQASAIGTEKTDPARRRSHPGTVYPRQVRTPQVLRSGRLFRHHQPRPGSATRSLFHPGWRRIVARAPSRSPLGRRETKGCQPPGQDEGPHAGRGGGTRSPGGGAAPRFGTGGRLRPAGLWGLLLGTRTGRSRCRTGTGRQRRRPVRRGTGRHATVGSGDPRTGSRDNAEPGHVQRRYHGVVCASEAAAATKPATFRIRHAGNEPDGTRW